MAKEGLFRQVFIGVLATILSTVILSVIGIDQLGSLDITTDSTNSYGLLEIYINGQLKEFQAVTPLENFQNYWRVVFEIAENVDDENSDKESANNEELKLFIPKETQEGDVFTIEENQPVIGSDSQLLCVYYQDPYLNEYYIGFGIGVLLDLNIKYDVYQSSTFTIGIYRWESSEDPGYISGIIEGEIRISPEKSIVFSKGMFKVDLDCD